MSIRVAHWGEDLIGYAQVTPLRNSRTGRLKDRPLAVIETRLRELGSFNWWRGEDPRIRIAVRAAAKMAARGLAHPVGGYTWLAPGKPYCDDPVQLVIGKRGKSAGLPVGLYMWGPCRKCEKCLLFRQMKWRERAMVELLATAQRGNRSWWVTLTFSPVHLAGILAEAVSATGGQSLQAVDRAAYGHVQRYLKRLRKASKATFRYLAVYERGEETGRSHYHLLIHETGGRPVLKRQLEEQWRSHVHARLVHLDKGPGGLASYVTKYATKSVEVRIRASQAYGREGRPTARQRRPSAGGFASGTVRA